MKFIAIVSSLLLPFLASAAIPVELPLPVVPDSLREPSQRADYVISHFYDALDFNSPESRDTASVEQNLVNFISLFPHASSPEVIERSVADLIGRAPSDQRELILVSAEKYLYDTESPMVNDEYYIPFAKAAAPSSPLHEYQLAQCMLNRPGTTAADFALTLIDGSQSTLSGALGSDRTLLIFYDPDCDTCHEVMAKVSVKSDVVSGAVKVVAVAIGDDAGQWRSDAAGLPQQWVIARPADDVEVDEIYSIRGFPTILMLDGRGTVVAKNVAIK